MLKRLELHGFSFQDLEPGHAWNGIKSVCPASAPGRTKRLVQQLEHMFRILWCSHLELTSTISRAHEEMVLPIWNTFRHCSRPAVCHWVHPRAASNRSTPERNYPSTGLRRRMVVGVWSGTFWDRSGLGWFGLIISWLMTATLSDQKRVTAPLWLTVTGQWHVTGPLLGQWLDSYSARSVTCDGSTDRSVVCNRGSLSRWWRMTAPGQSLTIALRGKTGTAVFRVSDYSPHRPNLIDFSNSRVSYTDWSALRYRRYYSWLFSPLWDDAVIQLIRFFYIVSS